jgi:hypothetical protein
MIKKSFFILLILFFFLTGCTGPIGGDYFFDKIQSLEEALNKEDWQKAETLVEDMKTLYKKHHWKLQFLGDESEYEGTHESLSRLKAAVQNKDSNQALLELATIKSYIEDIYSM